VVNKYGFPPKPCGNDSENSRWIQSCRLNPEVLRRSKAEKRKRRVDLEILMKNKIINIYKNIS